MEKRKKNDWILILCLLLLGVISFFGIEWYKNASTINAEVVVSVNGSETKRYSLNEEIRITIESADGGYNVLVVEGGAAWIEEASCPDKLCRNHGKISKNGETLVCLPNQVVVEIVNGEEPDVDMSTN